MRQYARKGVEEKFLTAEPGDILARPNSNMLPGSEKRLWGGLTGHIALVVKGGVFSNMDEHLGGIEVVEARLYNRYPISYENRIVINKASVHFGKRYIGRRYLLKMHLNEKEMSNLSRIINREKEKHYSLFCSKDDSSGYNCATFVRRLFLETMNYDIDCNKGRVIFPNDIINNPIFDTHDNRVRF
ncbi:MAG: hypothetical protein WC833_06780 [Bacteroidales bacterium]|jgi:hypothetical protein